MSDLPAVVCDNGSATIKAGYVDDYDPCVIMPTVVGCPKAQQGTSTAAKNAFVGDDALAKRGVLRLTHPIERGIITNWEDMEKIWH